MPDPEQQPRVRVEPQYIDFMKPRGLEEFCEKYGIDPNQNLDELSLFDSVSSIRAVELAGMQGSQSFDMPGLDCDITRWFQAILIKSREREKDITAEMILTYYYAFLVNLKATVQDPEIPMSDSVKTALKFGARRLSREESVLKFADFVGINRSGNAPDHATAA